MPKFPRRLRRRNIPEPDCWRLCSTPITSRSTPSSASSKQPVSDSWHWSALRRQALYSLPMAARSEHVDHLRPRLEWVHQGIRNPVIRAEARRRCDAVRTWCRPVFCHLFCRPWRAWLVLEHSIPVLHRFSGVYQRRGQRETEPYGKCAHHGFLWQAPPDATSLQCLACCPVRGNRLCNQLAG